MGLVYLPTDLTLESSARAGKYTIHDQQPSDAIIADLIPLVS